MHVTYRCITVNKWYDNKIYPPQFPLQNKLKVIKICPSFSEDNLRLIMLLSLDSSVQNAVYKQLQQCMQKLGVRIAFQRIRHKKFLPWLFLICVVIADSSLSPLAAQCRFSDLLAARLQTLAFIHFTEVGNVWARVRNHDNLLQFRRHI